MGELGWIFSGLIGLLLGAGGAVAFCREQCRQKLRTQELQQVAEEKALQERLRGMQAENTRLQEDRQRLESVRDSLRQECSGLRERLVASETRRERDEKALNEKLALLQQAETRLGQTFQVLSSQVLQQNSQSFLDLARGTLERIQEQSKGELEKRQQAVAHLVDPIQEGLRKMEQQVKELEEKRSLAYAGMLEQVRNLTQSQQTLQVETAKLVTALRMPHVRGQWGEMQLKRTVELAGMTAHCDFLEQQSARNDEGNLQRPDMVVRLPGGRNVVIDAKAPLLAFLESLEGPTPETRQEKLRQHARQIRDHMTKLSARAYWKQFDPTPEFVVLFLPGESFFGAALQEDPGLIEAAAEQRIVLATPMTLIALLRTVAWGWRQEEITREVQAISELGRELYGRTAALADHFDDLRKGLEKAVVSYNRVVGSMESRFLPMARKFRDLPCGVEKEIPLLEAVEKLPTLPRAEELMPSRRDGLDGASLDSVSRELYQSIVLHP